MTPMDIARDMDRDALRVTFRRRRTPGLYAAALGFAGALALAVIIAGLATAFLP